MTPRIRHQTAPGTPGADRSIGRVHQLEKLVDDLGSLSEVATVIRTFVATLDWRATQIEQNLSHGRHQAAIAVLQDLRNACAMVGADALAQWCASATADISHVDHPGEIVILADATRDWLEGWLLVATDQTA